MSSEDEIRRRYGAGKDVPVLKAIPTPNEVSEKKSFLIKVGEAFGLQEWMWKSWKGAIIAIIAVPPVVGATYDFWTPKVEVAYEFTMPYVSTLTHFGVGTKPEFVGFVKGPTVKSQQSSSDLYALAPAPENVPLPVATKQVFDLSAKIWRFASLNFLGSRDLFSPPPQSRFDRRWLPGHAKARVMYAALDPLMALAEIEAVKPFINTPYLVGTAQLKGLASQVELADLPENWREHQEFTRNLGAQWVKDKTSGILMIPSTIDPSKVNVIINMDHPSVQIQVVEGPTEGTFTV